MLISMPRLHTYVMAYDSGFAPNPFYGFCTLATCKPKIRRSAVEGDWIVGTASAARATRRGGFLVYAMKVTGALDFDQYWADTRFQHKKPIRNGSKKQSCGDNIYWREAKTSPWRQLDSFHSKNDGSQRTDHTAKDTGVNRVLFSDDFVYFGGEGPALPIEHGIRAAILHKAIGEHRVDDQRVIGAFVDWLRSLEVNGYVGRPHDWLKGYG